MVNRLTLGDLARRDAETSGRFADHARAGTADRAGRAENDESFRFAGCGAARVAAGIVKGRVARSPLKQAGGDPPPVAARPADERGEDRRRDERVEPVEHAAVAGDQTA